MTNPTSAKDAITVGEIHTFSTLMHLPYDVDKVTPDKHPELELKYDKNSDVYSFKGHNGETEYYKKISQTQSSDKSHDAAAFVQIDKNGNNVLTDGKPNVTVVFAGLNDPTKDFHNGLRDMTKTSSFSTSFYKQFEADLAAGAAKNGIADIDAANVTATGHSMGDKYTIEFAARHKDSKPVIMDGWDSKDALMSTALRETLLEGEGAHMTDDQFKEHLASNLKRLQERVVDVTFGREREGHITDNTYHIEGAAHRVANGLNVSDDRLKYTATGGQALQPSQNNKDMVEYAAEHANKFALDAFKAELKSDGHYSREDRQAFRQAKELLKSSGMSQANALQGIALATALPEAIKDLECRGGGRSN